MQCPRLSKNAKAGTTHHVHFNPESETYSSYGSDEYSDDTWFAQLDVGVPNKFEVPVMYELESQNKSGLFPPTWLSPCHPCRSMVERLAATRPP